MKLTEIMNNTCRRTHKHLTPNEKHRCAPDWSQIPGKDRSSAERSAESFSEILIRPVTRALAAPQNRAQTDTFPHFTHAHARRTGKSCVKIKPARHVCHSSGRAQTKAPTIYTSMLVRTVVCLIRCVYFNCERCWCGWKMRALACAWTRTWVRPQKLVLHAFMRTVPLPHVSQSLSRGKWIVFSV